MDYRARNTCAPLSWTKKSIRAPAHTMRSLCDQKTTSHNPRSTVGTVTEIYDYLRLLYARIGVPHCPVCGRVISQQSVDEMTRIAKEVWLTIKENY